MKILAISTAILLASSVSTYADNLSVSAKSDIAKAKPVVVLSHADIKSNGENASLGGTNGDFENMSHQMGFINAMKNTVSSSADYAFLLGLSQKNHAAYDALTRLIIIKELVKLNNRMDSIQEAQLHGCGHLAVTQLDRDIKQCLQNETTCIKSLKKEATQNQSSYPVSNISKTKGEVK